MPHIGWFVAGAASLVVLAAPAARGAEDSGPFPPSPAVYTARVSSVGEIYGDRFRFTPGLETMTIRLADATCDSLEDDRARRAASLATDLLRDEAFWIFPRAPLKAGAEVPARVWTRKGWLSEVLIKAHLGLRAPSVPTASAEVGEASLFASKRTPGAPFAPAFRATLKRVLATDRYELDRNGRPMGVRLFDAEAAGTNAEAAIRETVGDGPVWVFPSSQRSFKPDQNLPVRIWTAKGWLSDVLIARGKAKRFRDPDLAQLEVDPPKADPTPQPTRRPPGQKYDVDWVWEPVSVSTAKSATHGCESSVFTIPAGTEWRLAWDLKRSLSAVAVIVNVLWIDEGLSEVSRAGKNVRTFARDRGVEVIRHRPDRACRFYVRVSGASDLNIRIDYKKPVKEGAQIVPRY